MKDQSTSDSKSVLTDTAKREVIHKEIDLIQSAINRMAHNAFLVKGWTLSIIAFILTINTHLSLNYQFGITLFLILAFWGLDAYYLYLERAFRSLYKRRINERTVDNKWAMLYNLEYKIKSETLRERIRSFISWNSLFYGVLLLVVTVFWLIGECDTSCAAS